MPDNVEEDEVPSVPVDPQRLAAMDAASRRVGAGGLPQDGGPLSAVITARDPYAAIEQRMLQQSQARDASLKDQMALIDKQAGQYGQRGMSDLDRASMLFQAAGALSAPTRSGGLMESIGAAGTAVAGPLSKAAQGERDRQDKMMQLQLARAKLAGEMSGGMSPSDMLALEKARADAGKLAAGESKPVTLKINGEEVSGIFKNGKYYTMDGQEITAGTMPKVGTEVDESAIPPDIRAAGKEAMDSYRKGLGTQRAKEVAVATANMETYNQMTPVLNKAHDAYSRLAEMGAIGKMQDSAAWRAIQCACAGRGSGRRRRHKSCSPPRWPACC
jgi:hypothetical protein